jgi:membrane associated rhomboid family serine protease
MIPYRTLNPTRRTPILVISLLLANVIAFLSERSSIAAGYGALLADWGFVPGRFLGDPAGDAISLITSMFLHGSWAHLLGNLWFLWLFGGTVEERLGTGKFAQFYLLSGLAAAGLQLLVDPFSTVPMVGASGAIAGVLGAYLWFTPRARVVVLMFLFPVELPAWAVIVGWFGLQVFHGFQWLAGAAVGAGVDAGVAFFAHIGGFLAGLGQARAFSQARAALVRPQPVPRALGGHGGGRG